MFIKLWNFMCLTFKWEIYQFRVLRGRIMLECVAINKAKPNM